MSGVPCCAGPITGGGGGGGGGETLAQTLVIGNVTGGLPIIVTTGDSIDGETSLNLTSAAAAPASGLGGGAITALTGAGDGAGAGGDIQFATADGGDTGNGGSILSRAGNGGATSGNGGSILSLAGEAQGGNGNGGDLIFESGAQNGTGTRGLIVLRNTGNDTNPVRQVATTGTNGAASNTFVGSRDPNGNVTGSGGDYYNRADGVNSALFIHLGAVPSTVWTQIPTGGGGGALAAIDVARTTSKIITGTPSGLAFNSEQGGGFDAAVWTWTSGDNDIEVDNDGQYLIHGELSIDGTQSFEAGFVLDWFLNGVAIADAAHEHTTTIGAFDDQTAMISSTIIRTLSANDEIGFRISRDFGSGGSVIPNTARQNIVRLS